ncbi:hypothetical protein GDO86_008954 [Hymenochirus boettgeri]|uniref:Uncharacterized protein n=1 Tax=Hymenochirus boettgeri TaxID=247094 RepID=A0A8T2JH09_9PIPI|nr:hypothetical protein GDO86_008954 [Hymenochirus boettgeri]
MWVWLRYWCINSGVSPPCVVSTRWCVSPLRVCVLRCVVHLVVVCSEDIKSCVCIQCVCLPSVCVSPRLCGHYAVCLPRLCGVSPRAVCLRVCVSPSCVSCASPLLCVSPRVWCLPSCCVSPLVCLPLLWCLPSCVCTTIVVCVGD